MKPIWGPGGPWTPDPPEVKYPKEITDALARVPSDTTFAQAVADSFGIRWIPWLGFLPARGLHGGTLAWDQELGPVRPIAGIPSTLLLEAMGRAGLENWDSTNGAWNGQRWACASEKLMMVKLWRMCRAFVDLADLDPLAESPGSGSPGSPREPRAPAGPVGAAHGTNLLGKDKMAHVGDPPDDTELTPPEDMNVWHRIEQEGPAN